MGERERVKYPEAEYGSTSVQHWSGLDALAHSGLTIDDLHRFYRDSTSDQAVDDDVERAFSVYTNGTTWDNLDRHILLGRTAGLLDLLKEKKAGENDE